MNRQQLLDELEQLPYSSRVREMVELGRQAGRRQDVSAALAQMEQGNFYERHLALHSCYGSHDTARIMRALADPSRSIRKSALPLVALFCDDAQVQQALAATLPKQRAVLLRWLLKHQRQAPIDAFLTTLVGHDERPDDPHLLELLWFGSAGFVQPRLARLLPTATAVDWRRLARRHPALISHALLELATPVQRMDQRLRWQANAVLVTLSSLDPERALTLVHELARHIPLHQLDLSILARRRPNAVADLLLAADEQTSVTLATVAHRLSPDRLMALLVRRPGAVPLTDQWFRRLPPEQRVTLYRNFERGWRDADNALPSWLIGRLPREPREGEGARHATLPACAARPLQQIAYTAYLPWDEARHALDLFIRNPDANLRAAALGALVTATRYQRQRLPDLLAVLRARRNEQEPVRSHFMARLAELPPGMWLAGAIGAQHLDDLGQIIRDALDAADLSYATAASAQQLVLRRLPFQPLWGMQWLAALVKERGQLSVYRLEQHIGDADMRRLVPVLLPVFSAWAGVYACSTACSTC